MVGDIVGLLDALGAETAVVVGHDWGAPVAWQCALMRPDRVRGVVGLSVPFIPQGDAKPSKTWPVLGDHQFYMRHFQQPGVAEAEFDRDVERAILGFLSLLSGERPAKRPPIAGVPAEMMVPSVGGFPAAYPDLVRRPAWLDEEDLRVYVDTFSRSGFSGGLNWYRNIDRNWELGRPFKGAVPSVPAFFIAGDQDVVPAYPGIDRVVAALPQIVPSLRGQLSLPGCGHWTQQERPREVNEALVGFARSVLG